MAIRVADANGKSNAQAGDLVVTGGGIFRKNTDGTSTKVSTLKDYIGTDTTKDYSALATIANSVVARQGAGLTGGSSGGGGMGKGSSNNSYVDTSNAGATVINDYGQTEQTANGLSEMVSINGYNPNEYAQSYAGTSSSGASKIVGGVILALLGIAVLDRFVSGSGK